MEEIAHLNLDYDDTLLPGYRFCPTDSECIVYYLKRRIETGQHPGGRIHEVNLYDYHPEELAEFYQPCDDKWYFLTETKRKYTNGTRPNRVTKNLGTWRASQRDATVYDDMNRGRLKVGNKRSLAYFVKDIKTDWLMHEYTIDDPNAPVRSKRKLDLVLCKIYKTKRIDNKRSLEERNQLDNEPPPRRQRLSMDQNENVLQRQIQTQDNLQSPDPFYIQPVTTSHDSTVLQQYVHNPQDNNGDIQTIVDMQNPIQSTATNEDDSTYNQAAPLDVSDDHSSDWTEVREMLGLC